MDFWAKYGLTLAYGVGVAIGLALIIIGIVAKKNDRKLGKNKIFKATVLNCLIGAYDYAYHMEGFDIILEIETNKGKIRREIQRRNPIDTGTTVEVYYDSKKGIVRFVDEVHDEEKSYPIILMAFGVFCIIAVVFSGVSGNVANGRGTAGMVFGFLVSAIFVFLGFWLSVVRPHKINKNMIHCEKVEGKIVDLVKNGLAGKHGSGSRNYSYAYLYEYEYGGVKRTIKSKTSSSSNTHSLIGKKVDIIINHQTGDVFCLDDEKTGVGIGVALMIFGIAMLPFVLLVTKGM